MNTQPVGFRLTGPAFMFETHLAGRPQADRLCFYVDVHTYIRQAGEDESFVLVADDDAPPSLTSPATSDSSPPTPPIRPVPGAPEPDPPRTGCPGRRTPSRTGTRSPSPRRSGKSLRAGCFASRSRRGRGPTLAST